jgi:starch phosphorylase
LNSARAGKFSSDRTIREYCRDIWRVQPVPIRRAAQSELHQEFDEPLGARRAVRVMGGMAAS